MSEKRVTIEWRPGMTISAAVHETPGPGIVLAHGAGGNLDTAFLVEMSERLEARGISSLRFNFPYTENRRRVPDQAPVLEACYRAVAQQAAGLFPAGLYLGGKSMGGRMASHIVSQGDLPPVRGLVFLGYPLHPPGQQHKLRDKHLYTITTPMLFVEGTRDAFADRALLQGVLDRLGDRAKVHWIEGGDHSFKVPKREPAEVNQEILDAVVTFVTSAPPISS